MPCGVEDYFNVRASNVRPWLAWLGRIGRTFRVDPVPKRDEIQFDPDSLAYGEYGVEEESTTGKTHQL